MLGLFDFGRWSIRVGLVIDFKDKVLFLWYEFNILCLFIFVYFLIIFHVGIRFDGLSALVEPVIIGIDDWLWELFLIICLHELFGWYQLWIESVS